MNSIESLIEKLHLLPHPEGGFYAENYRSAESIEQGSLPTRFNGDRAFSTAIYFLLPAGTFSAFHKIDADECWHFYEGGPLHVYVINLNGELQIIKLGNDILNGEVYQAVVPAGCWFASKPLLATGYSLVGCTVAPGFDFAGFELAEKEKLAAEYPAHKKLIKQLCR